MKLNLLSIMLLGSGLFLTACVGDGNDDHSSKSSNVDVSDIQNPVVNTPQAYPSLDENLSNADAHVVKSSKIKGTPAKETQAAKLLLRVKPTPSAEDWPIGLGAWCSDDDC